MIIMLNEKGRQKSQDYQKFDCFARIVTPKKWRTATLLAQVPFPLKTPVFSGMLRRDYIEGWVTNK
jgi:hypothetical protein